MVNEVVVIGGVAAGSKAAIKIKRDRPDFNVTLVTQDTHIAYSLCGIPYFIEGIVDDYKKLIVKTPQDFEKQGIKVFTQNKCTKILPDEKKIITEKISEIFYDELIIATGALPIIPYNLQTNSENVFTIRSIEDGIKIREKMLASKNAVIIGGGYIGIELLEAFVKNNIQTTLIEKSSTIINVFDKEISELIKTHIVNNSNNLVEIITNDEVQKLDEVNGKCLLKMESGKIIETDFVIIAIGVRPNVELAKDCGIEIGETGGIKTSKRMKTSKDNIWAVGDCVEKCNMVSNKPCYIPLGSTANKEGRVAAINVCGGFEVFNGVLGSAVTKFFDYTMSLTGLTEEKALSVGFYPVSATVTKKDKASFMKDSKDITVKLVVDKNSREILGCQGIGAGKVDKRVNSVTSALTSSMTLDEFLNLDLTYSPDYSPTIDPLITAAWQIKSKLK